MPKSADAFRTISEVAEWLQTPTHVLRFWETKFPQVKPVKRAGNRRYYRASDMRLLGGIKRLLHEEKLTIKGVQKILREQGVKYVISLSQPLDGEDAAPPTPPTAQIMPFAPRTIPKPPPLRRKTRSPDPQQPTLDLPLPDAAPALPGFLTRPGDAGVNAPPHSPSRPDPAVPAETDTAAASAQAPDQTSPQPKPPPQPPARAANPGLQTLARLAGIKRLDASTAQQITPLRTRLGALEARLAARPEKP